MYGAMVRETQWAVGVPEGATDLTWVQGGLPGGEGPEPSLKGWIGIHQAERVF